MAINITLFLLRDISSYFEQEKKGNKKSFYTIVVVVFVVNPIRGGLSEIFLLSLLYSLSLSQFSIIISIVLS